MAITSGFFNSMNRDRRYNAEQMSQIFNGIITDGVFDNVGDLFMTVPGTSLEVLVKSGRAWFDGTWTYNNDLYSLKVEESDISLPRRDAVVLEVNFSDDVRRNSLKIITGTPGSSLPKPELTNTDKIHQHVLAYVTVRPNAVSITPADIENVVGTEECPFVTGILETASINDLYQQWEYQFQEWFKDVQSSLDGDTAGKLLNMINQRVKIEDAASREDILTGTDNNKWVSPYSIGDSIGRIRSGDMTSYIDVRSKLRDYIRKVHLYHDPVVSNNSSSIIINGNAGRFLRFDGLYFAVLQNASTNDKKIIHIYKYGFETLNDPVEIYTEELTIPSGFLNAFRPALIHQPYSNGEDTWIISSGLVYDFSRNKIVYTPSIRENAWGLNFVTAHYYGYFRYDGSDSSYLFIYCDKENCLDSDSYSTKKISVNDPDSKTGSIIGIYEDLLWIGSINSKKFILHKLDVSTQTFYEKFSILDFSSVIDQEEFTLLAYPIYYDERYTYFLLCSSDPASGYATERRNLFSKCLKFDRSNGESNYEEVLNSPFIGGDIFYNTPYFTYIGNDDEYAYCYTTCSYRLNLDLFLLKINCKTSSVSISSLYIYSDDHDYRKLVNPEYLRPISYYYEAMPIPGQGRIFPRKINIKINNIKSFNVDNAYMAFASARLFIDVKCSQAYLLSSDLFYKSNTNNHTETELFGAIDFSERGYSVPAGYKIMFFAKDAYSYTLDNKRVSMFIDSDEFIYDIIKYDERSE